MSAPTSTFLSYSARGNREDLGDKIYDITPTDTPFLNGAKSGKATAILHEWQTDALEAASGSNAVLEGDEATTDAATATTRLSNTCQISDKVPRVSGSQEAVDKAGRKSEMGYQIAKKAKELKRDIETILLQNQAEVTGDSSTARKLGSVLSWLDTNTSAGATGTDGSLGNTSRGDGTQRAFTESLLKTVKQAIWDAGGEPGVIMVGSFNKSKMSEFTGNATRQIDAKGKKLTTNIDVYEDDWGMCDVIANRFMRSRDCLILQMDMWEVAWLRKFAMKDLARTGDSERKQLLCEYTLASLNEKASGIVADLTTS